MIFLLRKVGINNMKKFTSSTRKSQSGSNKWTWLLVISTLVGTILDLVMIFNLLV